LDMAERFFRSAHPARSRVLPGMLDRRQPGPEKIRFESDDETRPVESIAWHDGPAADLLGRGAESSLRYWLVHHMPGAGMAGQPFTDQLLRGGPEHRRGEEDDFPRLREDGGETFGNEGVDLRPGSLATGEERTAEA